METMLLQIMVVMLSLAVYTQGINDALKTDNKVSRQGDFCQFEEFNPHCLDDEVIVMEKALIGRMQLSRCVLNEYGYLGCQTNVLDIISEQCSGVRSCSYDVPDLRKKSQACPPDLVVYLTAKYSCLKVVNSQSCNILEPSTLTVTSTSGYISSFYAYQNGTGSPNCPILIQASHGQKINITLHHFGDEKVGRDSCAHHIIVKDGDYVETMNLCNMLGKHNYYTSTSESLRIFFSGLNGLETRHLIHYQVVGCKPLLPPGDATFQVISDGRGSVKCGQTIWYVTCVGNSWTGKVGNCTKSKKGLVYNGNHVRRDQNGNRKNNHHPIGLIIAVVIGLVLGLLLGSALLVVVLLKRKSRRRRAVVRTTKSNTLLGGETSNYESEEHYYRHPCQANNCDGRCVAPSSYCGLNRVYNPVTHNYLQDVEMAQSSPCQAHAIYAKRPIESPYNTTPRNYPQNNNKFASILSSKPASKQSTTFSTFKPPSGDNDCMYDRFSTYQSRRGIIKMPTDSNTVCTCDKAEEPTSNNVVSKPDVVQTNVENETNSIIDGTTTLKKPQMILLPKTNNAKPT